MNRLGAAAVVVAVAALSVVAADPWASEPRPVGVEPDPLPDAGVLRTTERFVSGEGPLRHYPAMDGTGTPTGLQAWRTYTVGGNCCEHYLATTPGGWIVNLGKDFPTFSTNGGSSWWQAQTPHALIGAEGAVVAAPDDDIVGMTWASYGGDHVVTYRYDGDQDAWHFNQVNLKTPFYDRPWLGVAPGPFHVGDVEVPYVTFMIGGWPEKMPTYMSLDGLHYASVEHTYTAFLANLATGGPIDTLDGLPDFGVRHEVDHYLPHHEMAGTPLPFGGYLAPLPRGTYDHYRYAVLDQDLTWKALDMELPEGELFFDDDGGIHSISVHSGRFVHNYSADGGATWTEYQHEHKPGFLREWSFALDTERRTAVFLAHWSTAAGVDKDEVIRVIGYDEELAPDEILQVGDGDARFGSGLTSTLPRLDFNSVAILPDGRVVAAFGDSAHRPGFAIEEPGASVVSAPPVDSAGLS